MVIMMFRTNVFKEIVLPRLDNTDYRIPVDKKQFELLHSFSLKLEVINHQWRVNTDARAYRLIHHKEIVEYVEISGGEILTVETQDNDIIKCITFDDEISSFRYGKYGIGRVASMTIGKAE